MTDIRTPLPRPKPKRPDDDERPEKDGDTRPDSDPGPNARAADGMCRAACGECPTCERESLERIRTAAWLAQWAGA